MWGFYKNRGKYIIFAVRRGIISKRTYIMEISYSKDYHKMHDEFIWFYYKGFAKKYIDDNCNPDI